MNIKLILCVFYINYSYILIKTKRIVVQIVEVLY